jgi:hypothetical protein
MLRPSAPGTGPTQSPKPVGGSGAETPRGGASAGIWAGVGRPEADGVEDAATAKVEEVRAEVEEMVTEVDSKDEGIRSVVGGSVVGFEAWASAAERACACA